MHRHYYFIHIYCYIDSLACMRLSLYSHYIELCSCYMDYSYMSMPVFSLHDYFPLLILIFPLLDTWAVDMCGIPHLLFLICCYLVLCYQQSSCPVIMLHVPCTVLVPDTLCTLNVLHITWGWETWRLTRSCLVDVWIHRLSHCRGQGSAGYPPL